MKICHIVNSLETGGAQTLVEALLSEREAHTAAIAIVLLGNGTMSARIEAVADEVVYLGRSAKSVDVLRMVREVSAIVGSRDVDVLHSHLLQADLISAMVPSRYVEAKVSTVHTTGMTSADPIRSRLIGRAVAVGSRRFDGLVACSRSAADYMASQGYDSGRCSYIANGVAVPDGIEVHARTSDIVSLARWHPMKGHATLFEAFALARRSGFTGRLVCAGEGMTSTNTEVQTLLKRLGIADEVSLLGVVPHPRTLIAGAGAMVFSSEYGEALPMAALESISQGTPVISTTVGDLPNLVVDPKLLCDPKDVHGLADSLKAFERMSSREYEDLRLRSHALARAEYSIASTSSKYSDLYHSLTGTK